MKAKYILTITSFLLLVACCSAALQQPLVNLADKAISGFSERSTKDKVLAELYQMFPVGTPMSTVEKKIEEMADGSQITRLLHGDSLKCSFCVWSAANPDNYILIGIDFDAASKLAKIYYSIGIQKQPNRVKPAEPGRN